MYDISPENRRAMFGGGRYDNLVGLFGKDRLPGVGFGMGDVTLQHFLETHGLVPTIASAVDVFIGLPKMEFRKTAEEAAAELRRAGLRVITPLEVAVSAPISKRRRSTVRGLRCFSETLSSRRAN